MVLTIISLVAGLIRGPLFSILDKLIPDGALKAKLKAEIEARLLDHDGEVARLQADLVALELQSESWLTRSWRPCLMYLAMLLLAVYGLLLPFAESLAGRSFHFEPHWQDFPDGLWNLLMLGVGGYIGGRTVEKLSSATAARNSLPRPRGNWTTHRRGRDER